MQAQKEKEAELVEALAFVRARVRHTPREKEQQLVQRLNAVEA